MPETIFKIEPGKQELSITHVFDAPPDRVFKALTDPRLIAQWWGPRKYETIVDKMEVKVGGIWRFINRDASGAEYAFHGVYHEILAPTRMVQTFEFEGMPGHVSLETATLEDADGKTLFTAHSVYQSVEDRDGNVQAGMEAGARETYERLDEIIAKV
jgi:uncharacterized protein YndB with AHSA1/START domain